MPKNINRPSLLGARLLVILAVALAACAAAKAAHAEGVSALHGAGAATRPRVAWREAASNSAHFPARTPLAEPGQGQQQPRSSRSQGAGEAGEEEEEEGGYGHWTIGFGISVMFSFLSSLGINLQKKSLMQHVGVPAFRQPVWVTGFLLVAFGSLLDFVAFGLAPQSLLAPLAALTLVWNMCISVRVLGEALTVRHVRATLVIFAGCTLTVVFAHKATPAYTLDDLKSLYAQPSMIAYLIIMPAFMALHYAYVRRARRHAQSSYAALVEDELHHDPELGASNQALLRSQDVTPGADARSPGGLELGGLRAAANDMASASGGAPMSPMSPSRVQHGATPSARDRRAHNAWPLPSSTTTATSPVPAALPSRPLTQALAESVEEEESSVTVAPLELITGMKQRSPGFWNRVTLIAYGGLAGSFGGQTVLFAKSTVELLKSAVFHGDDGLRHVEAYLIIAGLAACLVGQVHFLNGGLKRHDSLQMVPVYQAYWIICSTVSGLVYFDELRNVTFAEGLMFVLGLTVTIGGVASLAFKRERSHSADATDSEASTEQAESGHPRPPQGADRPAVAGRLPKVPDRSPASSSAGSFATPQALWDANGADEVFRASPTPAV